jgi:hypothetical protein
MSGGDQEEEEEEEEGKLQEEMETESLIFILHLFVIICVCRAYNTYKKNGSLCKRYGIGILHVKKYVDLLAYC